MKPERSFRQKSREKFLSLVNPDGPAFRITLVVLTLAVGLLYVLQMNISATKGYDIRALEQQRDDLQKQASQMQLDAVELQSVQRILADLPNHNLVESRPDGYISTASTAVAQR